MPTIEKLFVKILKNNEVDIPKERNEEIFYEIRKKYEAAKKVKDYLNKN